MAPEMSAAVMMQNVPWNAMNSMCGMVPLRLETDAAQEDVATGHRSRSSCPENASE